MMTAERARELLDAYGSKATNWPAEYRLPLQAFFDDNVDAQQWLRDARELDDLLDASELVLPDLTAEIMRAVPTSLSERILAWLLPQSPGEYWRPAIAAACPLIVGLAIGVGDPLASEPALYAASAWDATEAALLEPLSSGIWYE